LMATLPLLQSLKVSIRGGTVGTVVTDRMFEPWGRHSRLRYLTVDDIHETDLPRLRKLCEHMPCIRHCRILSQKAAGATHPRSAPSSETSSLVNK
ncbi:hypothetical protein EV175_002093, partial [Coemansia sp. RSA 1933]